MSDLFNQICGMVEDYNKNIIRKHEESKTSEHIKNTFKEDEE